MYELVMAMKTALAITLALLTLGAMPRPRPTEVHITFSGIVTHVLDPAHPARAVMIRGEGHMLHRATLYLRASEIEWSDLALSCDTDGACAIPLGTMRVRFAGPAGRPMYDNGGTFDVLVPHLRAVTGGAMTALRAEVSAATFDLPNGRYSATPHEERGMFAPDLENRGARRFSREVFRSARVVSPELQLFDGTTWRSIRFRSDEELIELRFTNEPLHAGAGHFALHYDLAATPLATRPTLTPSAVSLSFLTSECSNSQFP